MDVIYWLIPSMIIVGMVLVFFLIRAIRRVTMMILREKVIESYLMRTKKSENNTDSG